MIICVRAYYKVEDICMFLSRCFCAGFLIHVPVFPHAVPSSAPTEAYLGQEALGVVK